MSIKLSSFDAMTDANKITALMHVKDSDKLKRDDFFLVLHALLDADHGVRMAAKHVYARFSGENYYLDLKGLDVEEQRKKIEATFKNVITAPRVIDCINEPDQQSLGKTLQQKTKKYEMIGEWDGPFPRTSGLLNALRDDTVSMVSSVLNENEIVERAYPAFFSEALTPFRECQRSLDGSASSTVVNLNGVTEPGSISPYLETMFSLLDKPIYLVVILTSNRLILFLRDRLSESRACFHAVPYDQISEVMLRQKAGGADIQIETPFDLIVVPRLHSNDAFECEKILREKSIESIQSSEDFIERDFARELKRLELLFEGGAIRCNEYMFRKLRLQKMELEKFSDSNIEAILARRFGDPALGSKFDEQIMSRFTEEKTVMFTDIVGYSKKASEKLLIDTMTLLAVHDKMLMPIIKEQNGQLIKKIGDALMVKFDDPLQACNAAIYMQRKLIAFNRESPEKILIRIGINTGTVFSKGGDVFGDAVNVAARMESMAQPGMIFLTETTYESIKSVLPCEDYGLQSIKGRQEPVRIFSIVDETNANLEMQEHAREFRSEMNIEESRSKPAEPAGKFPENAKGNAVHAKIETRPAETISEAVLAMKTAVDVAMNHYRQAVRLGFARDGEIESWFGFYHSRLKNK